jgi:hypothetical protein
LFGLSARARGQFLGLDANSGKFSGSVPASGLEYRSRQGRHLLFLLHDDAKLIVARSNKSEFEPLKRYTVADIATWAQPAISGNRVS